MLNQGRYTWRHNSILNHIWQLVNSCESVENNTLQVNVDLPGHNVRTIPLNILPTTDRPDLVIIDYKKKDIIVFELTVPFEPNISKSHCRKQNKYAALAKDVKQAGFNCQLLCFEVGSRGFISKENKGRLHELMKRVGLRRQKKVFNDLSKLALVTSYGVYTSRNEPSWNENGIFLLHQVCKKIHCVIRQYYT